MKAPSTATSEKVGDAAVLSEPLRLEPLSGLRFFAVAYVVVRHLGGASLEGAPMILERVRRHAYMVMPLFFVMSGFVLTYRYAEPIKSRVLRAPAFWISRATRIWPIYLVALAVHVVADAREMGEFPGRDVLGAISQTLLLQGWMPSLVWFGNAPGWTVSVEAFLYLLFPWLVVRVVRMPIAHGLALGVFVWVLGQMAPLAYVMTHPDGWPPKSDPWALYLDLLRFLPPLHLPSFLLGIIGARVFMHDRATGRRRAGDLLTVAGLLPIGYVLVGGIELVSGKTGFSLPLFCFGHNGLLAPAWALVLLGLSHSGPWFRWLGCSTLVRLGNASYGLYILHYPVYDAVSAFLLPHWDHSRFFLVQLFALLLPLTVLSFEQFEEPLRSALLERFSPRAERTRLGALGG